MIDFSLYDFILQSLGNMFLFQYLVSVLEGDFLPRNTVYKGKLPLRPDLSGKGVCGL